VSRSRTQAIGTKIVLLYWTVGFAHSAFASRDEAISEPGMQRPPTTRCLVH